MSSRTTLAATLLVAFAIPTARAHAQAMAPAGFTISAGASAPEDGFGSRVNSGFVVTGAADFRQRGQPLGFRLEGSYNEFGVKDVPVSNNEAITDIGNAKILALTANIVLANNPGGNGLYGIGGLGFYNIDEPGAFQDFEGDPPFLMDTYTNNVGVNFGVGYRFALSGLSAQFEVRWHRVANSDYSFIPITFGITF